LGSIQILAADYREINRREHGSFDKVVSFGMFEHVGPKNHRAFMKVVDDVLTEGGLLPVARQVHLPERRHPVDPAYRAGGRRALRRGGLAQLRPGLLHDADELV
jgi:cyclopropane fatty-acyl-phospholipid synthase-like methyltransferase